MEEQNQDEGRPSNQAGHVQKLTGSQKHKLALTVLISLSAGFFGGWAGGINGRQFTGLDTQSNEAKQQIILSESRLINEIAKTVGASVVSVNVVTNTEVRGFFGFDQPLTEESAGTGVIISDSGLVVTNRHVVPRGISQVSVTLSDGTELDNVEVVGRTSSSDPLDVAFLRIKDAKGKTLIPAKMGDSSKVQVGDRVIAIGNALGQFQNTVTSGIISGFGRSVIAGDEFSQESLQNLFQTDTAINQGNSGGPLVNINGEVIAINTAVAGNAENIGFAIPINDLAGLIKSVLEKGVLLRPYLGVRYISLTDDIAYQFDLPVKRGAYIPPSTRSNQRAIIKGSPADKAGIKEGDIITKINDINIDETNSLVSVLGRFAVDETISLSIRRGNDEIKLSVKLEAAPTE